MQVFKTDKYPTKEVFLSIVERYQEYSAKRRAAQNIPPQRFPDQVKEYVAMLENAARNDTPPEEIEFINMTYEEHQEFLKAQKAKDDETALEEAAATRRIEDIEKSITDVEFRKDFLRSEVYSAGYTFDEIIWAVVAQLAGLESKTAYFQAIENKREEFEQEIRAAANSKGVTYVEE